MHTNIETLAFYRLVEKPGSTVQSTFTMSLRSRPLDFKHFNVSFPDEKIVQVTLNRTEKLNCIDLPTSREIQKIWELFDQDESLWVGIITGTGRAFCTGADLQGKPIIFCGTWEFA